MLGATGEPVYQVLEFLKPFNFPCCNPRIPALAATPLWLGRLRPISGQLSAALPAPAR
jgi:hypothetical protein